ncbi:MAG: hypothetical protein L0G23_00390 [Ruaniaceae bacterium]|nr:hypothetical protein [Ruaniaceae bacterium]
MSGSRSPETRIDPWITHYADRTRGMWASEIRSLFAVAVTACSFSRTTRMGSSASIRSRCPRIWGQMTMTAYLSEYDWYTQVKQFRSECKDRGEAMLPHAGRCAPCRGVLLPLVAWAHVESG